MSTIYCAVCQTATFHEQSDGSVACCECGTINEVRTSYINFVDTQDGNTVRAGATGRGYIGNEKESMRLAAEERFTSDVKRKAVLWLFHRPNILGLDPDNNPLGDPGIENKFVQSVLHIYQQIRHADAEVLDMREETVNSGTRRLDYQLAVAIRLAAMQNNLILAYNTLKEWPDEVVWNDTFEWKIIRRKLNFIPVAEDTFPASLAGCRPVVDKYLPVPLPHDLVRNLKPPNSAQENPIPDRRYLIRTQSIAIRTLRPPNDPFHVILSNIGLCLQRFREIVHAPTHEIRKERLSYKKKSNRAWRKWKEEDFAYFQDEELEKKGAWKEVLETATNLYRASQVVSLWGQCSSYPYAVALVYTAVIGQVKQDYKHSASLIAELCAQYDVARWCSVVAINSLRRMIIAWTSSIGDAEIPAPDRPSISGKLKVGEGNTGYRGDSRRPIPIEEIWAVSIKPVAEYWRNIYLARMAKRPVVMPFQEELYLTRILVAEWTAAVREKEIPRALPGTGPAALVKLAAGKVGEKEGLSGSATPIKTVKKVERDPDVLFKSGPEIQTQAPHPDWYPTVRRAEASILTPEMEARYEALEMVIPDKIEEMIRSQDSSDEEDGYSSGEDRRSRRSSILKGMKKEEYRGLSSFTVGLGGLTVESIGSEKEEMSYSGFDNRGQSVVSDMSSASETERVLGGLRDRNVSPSMSASTLHSFGSAYGRGESMSRTRSQSYENDGNDQMIPTIRSRKSDWTPRPNRPAAEMSADKGHIATLAREREEYAVYDTKSQRMRGRLVSKAIEEYVNGWLVKEQAAGRIPKKITEAYLRSIGLGGRRPMTDRLDSWILTQQWRWSALEAVLRAGIRSTDLPVWMVPRSLLAVKRSLEHAPELSYIAIIPECPPIPQKFKDDPIHYRHEINKIKAYWEQTAFSDDFPYLFKADEILVFKEDEADTLFEPGEWEMYIADEKEVEERKNDKDHMAMITMDPAAAAAMEKREKDRRRGKKVKKHQDILGDLDGPNEFSAYARALDDEDCWAGTGIAADMMAGGMGIGVEGEEEGDGDSDEENSEVEASYWDVPGTSTKTRAKPKTKVKRKADVLDEDGETPSVKPKRAKKVREDDDVVAGGSKEPKARKTPAKVIKEVVVGQAGELSEPAAKKRKAAEEVTTAEPKKQKTTAIVEGPSSAPIVPPNFTMANFMKQTIQAIKKRKMDEAMGSANSSGPSSSTSSTTTGNVATSPGKKRKVQQIPAITTPLPLAPSSLNPPGPLHPV